MKWPLKRWALTALLLYGAAAAPAGENGNRGYLLDISGGIGPATADYFDRAMDRAEQQQAELVVLRMDTPGGLDTSMRVIIKRIISARVPVVGYVAPGGARAASAGTYILYASHVAVMAPGTNLGAATPVNLIELPKGRDSEHAGATETDSTDAKERKVINDAAAYIRGLARLRGRNATWAEQAVREAASLSAREALEQDVIDLLAGDIDELKRKLDGRRVELAMGGKTLNTQNLSIEQLEPDWQSRLLSIISNPNVAYILMLLGIYGLIYEFANPGAVVPGTAGAIALLLALYAFHVLPVNYAGMALLLFGLALMVAEAFVPSFGALGIGGVAAFVFGSLILIDTDQPGYGISLPLILTLALTTAFLLVILVGMALKSRKRPVVSGREELLGAEGVVLYDFNDRGEIRIHGEVWSAHTDQPLHRNQSVRVTRRDGLTLWVTPKGKREDSS
ncbi:MAG: nodulation protein NfeD [Gammaproteobacteria bacterium]|nr:nodulation protein NfeD [Gammaproteobacteria bacterium]